MSTFKEDFDSKNYWGISTSVDAYNCDPQIIRSSDKINEFVIELCKLIEMKRYGLCRIVNFGEDERVAGLSFTQLIETSLVSGHFSNMINASFIDIFSCKYYDPAMVSKFVKDFFQAAYVKVNVLSRESQ